MHLSSPREAYGELNEADQLSGILLNAFKEELPKERESRFWAGSSHLCGTAGDCLTEYR